MQVKLLSAGVVAVWCALVWCLLSAGAVSLSESSRYSDADRAAMDSLVARVFD